MTGSDYWETVNYHILPHWMKRVSKPKHWIKNTYTKIFYGKPYDYKVEYAVVHGKLHINYWRKRSTENPIAEHKSKSTPVLFYLLIIIVLAGIGFIWYNNSDLLNSAQSSIIPSPTIIAAAPSLSPTPLQTIRSTPIPTTPNINFKQSPKTTSYSYISKGNHGIISFTTYGGLADHFSKEDHSYYHDFEKETIMELLKNDNQDEYLQPLIETIKKKSNNPDDQAKIAISLVQYIPYNWNAYYGVSKGWYYPYETLYNNKGVCADKSLLLAYLLNQLGYDTIIFEFSDHMAVGVKSSSNYDFYDSGYAFIETTRPTIITYIPDTYYGGFTITPNPNIIHLNGGKNSLDVSQEYRDATRLKQLEAMGEVLDQTNYYDWARISNYYDLQYDS